MKTIESFFKKMNEINPFKKYDYTDYSYYKTFIPDGLTYIEYEKCCKYIADKLRI